MTATRRLLEAFADPKVNDDIAWLSAQGLIGVMVTAKGLEVRVTSKGRVWLNAAEAFHPSKAPA